MGKKHSGFAECFAKWIFNCKSDRSKLLKSVVSLVLASVILVTCTFCWYCLKTAEADADNFTLNAGKGLRVNDTGTSQFNNKDNNFSIIPASSVDGSNLFFPTDGTDFSDVTKDITFRSANAGDKNKNYIQIDFDVTAQANRTSIYINDDPEKTWLKVKTNGQNDESAQQAAPLRMAIWANAPDEDGNPMHPIVFNSQDKTVNTAAVSEVDRTTGKYLSNAKQVAHPFSDYAVGATPLTTLSAGKKTVFSVIIWLEGCDPKCTLSKISKKDISLGLAFKTSWDNTDVIRFKDNTTSHWVSNKINTDKYNLTVRYTEDVQENPDIVDFNTYKYRNSNNEWTASIPSDMKNKITFILTPPSGGTGDTYIFCRQTGSHSTSTENRGVNRQYVIEDASLHSTPSECEGRWVALGDSDGGGVDIGDLGGDDF